MTGEIARRWRYQSEARRDLRIDLLRGFAVFAMAVDHVAGDSPFRILSGGDRFLVSAAEAFVFISGVTVGIVYCRPAAGGMRTVAARAFGRSWTLYAIAVWLGIAFAAAYAITGSPRGDVFGDDPLRFTFELAALQRTYYLVEVMLLYAFLMTLVPGAYWLLRRGWWPALVGISALLWLSYQLVAGGFALPWRIEDYRNFPLAAWQILFVGGIILGYYREPIARSAAKFRPALPGGWLLPLGVLFLGTVWLHETNASIVDHWGGSGAGRRLLDTWFDRTALPLPRLLVSAVLFSFAWQLTTQAWKPVSAAFGQFLLPLGSHALYAYSAHVVGVGIIEIAVFRAVGAGPWSTAASFAAQGLLLLFVWSTTRLQLLGSAVAWLGNPPFRRLQLRDRESRIFRPAYSLVAIAVLLSSVVFGLASTPPPSAARRAAFANPVTTVTPPRASIDEARIAARTAPPDPNAGDGIETVAGNDLFSLQGELQDESLDSAALGKTMPYAVYLPPGYASDTDTRYPVLYMLHGVGGLYTEWSVMGLPKAADELIVADEMQPMIIVMPEGGSGYWVNGLSGAGERWTDYVVEDLVPLIDAKYRTLAAPNKRAVGGLSRGGFGALYLAFTHPELFGIVGGHSAALPTLRDVDNALVTEKDYTKIDPVALAAALDPRHAPVIWLDIGTDDDWRSGVDSLDAVLTSRKIPYTVNKFPGGHEQAYWLAHLTDYLQFYANSFAR